MMKSPLMEIPLDKLIPSPANVRKTAKSLGIEELAASIEAHGLLQSLSVRPELDQAGAPTGRFLVSGGSRRLQALKLLAKQKRITRNTPVPCLLNEGDEEAVSLAENILRTPLHPADQFDSFKRLIDKGAGIEETAARFGVTPQILRQRLRLAAVSPKLLKAYRDEKIDLDAVMAFSVVEDHGRQEAVFASLPEWNRTARDIRFALTRGHIRASDKSVKFVGIDAYQEAGGLILRDLFAGEGDDAYLTSPDILDKLAHEKLSRLAIPVLEEGWSWVETLADFPYSHGWQRIYPQIVDLSAADEERYQALRNQLSEIHGEDETSELDAETDKKCAEIESEIDCLEGLRSRFSPEIMAVAGAVISIGYDGKQRIERGYVKKEDLKAYTKIAAGEPFDAEEAEAEEDEVSGKRLSDALIRDLTAHKTLALRVALTKSPDIALLALTHSLAAQCFYGRYDKKSCLDLEHRSAPLRAQAVYPLDPNAEAELAGRHEAWEQKMPKEPAHLWEFLAGMEEADRGALLAHCVAISIFAVQEPFNAGSVALKSADKIAEAINLDMTAFWTPTAKSYFGRVTKERIIEAIAESGAEADLDQLQTLKKKDLALAAETAVEGTGWLPDILKTAALTQSERRHDGLSLVAAE